MVSRNFDPAKGNKGFGAVHKVLKFYSRTCINFTSGGLIVSVILCDSQRQISFNSRYKSGLVLRLLSFWTASLKRTVAVFRHI
jgi:hypothetical protein